MKALALSGLEAALNRCLAFDESIADSIKPLLNKQIKIQLTDLQVEFSLIFGDGHISVVEQSDQPANTIISGTMPSFLMVALNKGSQSAVFKSNMTISGDLAVAEKLSALFRQIDIDWEAHLARITGDTLAHQIAFRGKQLKGTLSEVAHHLKNTAKDFLFYEARYFPKADDVEDFYLNIAVLKQDIERLEARIQKLQSQQEKNT